MYLMNDTLRKNSKYFFVFAHLPNLQGPFQNLSCHPSKWLEQKKITKSQAAHFKLWKCIWNKPSQIPWWRFYTVSNHYRNINEFLTLILFHFHIDTLSLIGRNRSKSKCITLVGFLNLMQFIMGSISNFAF